MRQMALELEVQNLMQTLVVCLLKVQALMAQDADNAELLMGPEVEALPNDMVDTADKVA